MLLLNIYGTIGFYSNNKEGKIMNRKVKTIDSLIGSSTKVTGDTNFSGGLRIDGYVKGNIIGSTDFPSMVVISENAHIEGDIHADHVVINGKITGKVVSNQILELQPKARINGDVQYLALEMHSGAIVSGKLAFMEAVEEKQIEVMVL